MRYVEMGLAFAAVTFVVANSVSSLLTAVIWRFVRKADLRSRALFLLRMFPAVASAGFVLGLVLPAFWLFEPADTTERLSPALFVFVVIAGILVVAGWRRAGASWLETRRLERAWRAAAVDSTPLAIPVRAYRVPSEMPLAALVGIVRPRLFVSDRFLDVLSADEREAVLAHEAGHLVSFDNLKRIVMRLAPDGLSLSPVGREIEAAWAIAAEEEADDHAAGAGRDRSLDLAGALLKAVRLTPMHCAPVSNFYNGATIAQRVSRLLSERPAGSKRARPTALHLAWIPILLAAGALFSGPALRVVYAVTESTIQRLQ